MKKLRSVYALPKKSLGERIRNEFITNRYNYLLLLPALAYYVIFHYWPMYGAQIAFRDYYVTRGIWASNWVGLKHFAHFFNSFYFERLIRNTVLLSGLNILFGFPAPIILALLLNEVRNAKFKRSVQTITYLPHFISLVVIAGIVLDFTRSSGVINDLLAGVGLPRIPFMQDPRWFRTVYIVSDIWQQIGWGSIIYLSAISSIEQEIYEAGRIDGTNRWQEMKHITLPGIATTIIVLMILRVGRIMSIGYEKVLLLYNESTYETADIIATYVYRRGIQNAEYSFSAAVGLFNSVINMMMLLSVNYLSRRYSEHGLF